MDTELICSITSVPECWKQMTWGIFKKNKNYNFKKMLEVYFFGKTFSCLIFMYILRKNKVLGQCLDNNEC